MAEPQSRIVAAGDLDVHYLELGSGTPLLLLHGGTATANISWDIPFATLSERWRLIAPDTRAHGRTTNPAGYLTFGQMANDVVALIDALRLEQPVIVGFSDGGQTALEVALHHRGLARALVVCGTASQASPAILHAVQQFGFSTPGEYDVGAVQAAFGEYYETLGRIHGEGGPKDRDRLLKQLSSLWLDLPDYTENQLRTITDPVLVIAGDRDELASLDEQVRLYRTIPGAELGIVPGSSHGAIERPLFWAMVEDFLERTLPRDRTPAGQPPATNQLDGLLAGMSGASTSSRSTTHIRNV